MKVFLSYVFEDYRYRDQVADWAHKGLLGRVSTVFESEDVRQGGDRAIWNHLRPILRDADVLLVLTGQDAHNRRWVDDEVHYFLSSGKPVIWCQLPGTTGAPPAEIRGRSPVSFSPEALRVALHWL